MTETVCESNEASICNNNSNHSPLHMGMNNTMYFSMNNTSFSSHFPLSTCLPVIFFRTELWIKNTVEYVFFPVKKKFRLKCQGSIRQPSNGFNVSCPPLLSVIKWRQNAADIKKEHQFKHQWPALKPFLLINILLYVCTKAWFVWE